MPDDPTADTLSPTSMVLNYLRSKGMQPTSENVRRTLEANARDPSLIPGLRNDVPATEADDQAAMAAARGGARGGGGRPLPVPPIPPADGGGDQRTSAAPSTGGTADTGAMGGSGIGPLGMSIAAGIPAAALMYGASRIPAMPQPGASVPPPVDPGAGVPRVAGPDAPLLLPGPDTAAASPMETAMQRAIAGPPQPTLLGPPSPTAGVEPRPGMANLPPQGPVEAVAPQVPFNSQSPRRPPTPAEIAALQASRTSPTLRGVMRGFRPRG